MEMQKIKNKKASNENDDGFLYFKQTVIIDKTEGIIGSEGYVDFEDNDQIKVDIVLSIHKSYFRKTVNIKIPSKDKNPIEAQVNVEDDKIGIIID